MDQKTRGIFEFYVKKYVNIAVVVLSVVLMVPTMAILVTWNTLPGEQLYPVKSYLEKVALKLVGDNFAVRSDLQRQFVGQRFQETQVLLAQSSGEGLENLTWQIQVTKKEIVEAKNSGDVESAVVAQEKAEKFVKQLREYEEKLETTRQELEVNATPTPMPTPTPRPQPTIEVISEFEEAEETTQVEEIEIVEAVEDVQEEISNVIEELEEIADSPERGSFGSEDLEEIVKDRLRGNSEDHRQNYR